MFSRDPWPCLPDVFIRFKTHKGSNSSSARRYLGVGDQLRAAGISLLYLVAYRDALPEHFDNSAVVFPTTLAVLNVDSFV